MARTLLFVLSIGMLACISGCGCSGDSAPGYNVHAKVGAAVPPEHAQVTLSNPRLVEVYGKERFVVDYKFTQGVPVNGRVYRLMLVSGSGSTYWIDNYFSETAVTGTVDFQLSRTYSLRERSRYFEGHLETLVSGNDWKTISNTVAFGVPVPGDIVQIKDGPETPAKR
jgi:hypothetical protein